MKQLRNKVADICKSRKCYKAISKAPANHSESYYPQVEKTLMAGLSKWLHKAFNNSSSRL